MRALRIFLLILIIIGVILLLTQKFWVPKLVDVILSNENVTTENIVPAKIVEKKVVPVSISIKNIKEDNFTGKFPNVSGTSILASGANDYVKNKIAEFKSQADIDVPKLRRDFGADNPTANYEIDINAKYIEGVKTESIVMDVYTFTGGAHGSSVYKVITVSKADGKILFLNNIIKRDQQSNFVKFVKNELNKWVPEGSDAPVVFPEEVDKLTFNSFNNFSLDKSNLFIYFDQYAIGPGVLGEVAFPLSLESIKGFLQ